MLVMGKILICRHCPDLKDHKSKREEAILFCEEAMAGGPWLNDEPGRGFLAQVGWGLQRQKVLVGWTWAGHI